MNVLDKENTGVNLTQWEAFSKWLSSKPRSSASVAGGSPSGGGDTPHCLSPFLPFSLVENIRQTRKGLGQNHFLPHYSRFLYSLSLKCFPEAPKSLLLLPFIQLKYLQTLIENIFVPLWLPLTSE